VTPPTPAFTDDHATVRHIPNANKTAQAGPSNDRHLSSFNRLASGTLIALNFLRQLQVAALRKTVLPTQLLHRDAASSFQRNPTICASVNRFFIVRPFRLAGL
jgi:hypothetical protein